ncbi:MAG: ASCH domain-containing protein [Planctomycetota bacterium]|jgi:hypothetical protein
MKALSVREPWASLIAEGIKTVELRTWKTDYRGPLLICASRSAPTKEGREAQQRYAITTHPGHARAIVELVACVPAVQKHSRPACCAVTKGEYAWILENPRPVTMEPVAGRLGLFSVEWPPVTGEHRQESESEER